MSSARRPLLTATAAGTMLLALWFVPSANATVEDSPAAGQAQSQQRVGAAGGGADQALGSVSGSGSADLSLADTGSVDTAPYLLGGTAFLGCGAALIATAARRSRTAPAS